ncbi:YobI family P-loop NTPase [Paenibacillus lautus]
MRKKGASENENKYNFQKLTPNDNVELKVYKDAFDYVFSNPDIINVAISGAYGAGKSSVIASYKKRHDHLRFVHVSLARFRPSDTEDESQVKESVLEGKILNQLIHQIPSHKIPQTNFKVKRRVEPRSFIFSTLLTMILAFALLHIFFFQKWSKYVTLLPASQLRDLLNITTNNHALLVSGLLGAGILSIFLYKLVKVQMNKNVFRKISLQGNEIEIFEESNESYFDKYLNEVLYLFENIKTDVIVFEDMDRFNISGIFERLREINTLVNTQRTKDKKSPIRFFYLLRDDIFISKDRTKFFDYIVPVVPVVDSSNSYDQFISHFKEGDIFELFDENFLQGLSLYIDDMRLLKNIYNEFVVYYNRLNTTELDCNRMLAMIAYKNLFPRDFGDLQFNQGMVFALFAKKDDFIEKELERIDTLVHQKKSEISAVKNEHLTSIQELDDAYNAKRSRLSNNYWNNQSEIQELDKEHPLRKQVIEKKLNNCLPILEEELLSIQQEIANTKNKQLKDIITRDNIESIFKLTITNEIGIETNFHEIKGSEYFDLLKYLIRNGYIDETYPDYMTYFYENSLSRVDKTFLRSITDKKAKEYTYELKNLKLVISRIREVDFDQEEILNFDLLEYLIRTSDNEIFLNRFIRQLRETKNFEFVGAYFDTQRELHSYIMCLNHQWPEMFQVAVEGKHLSEKQIRLLSIYTLYYSNDDDIRAVNSENCLTRYISSSSNYLDINEPNVDKLIHGFIELDVSFIGINQANAELLNGVYINSLYEINFENLSLMLNKFYLIDEENDIYHRNYTLINSQPGAPLANYIEENISDYVNVVLLNCKDAITDDEKIVLLLLNNEKISTDQKNTYIEFLQTPVTLIKDVHDDNLWSSLLSNGLVNYSEENAIQYFRLSKKLDFILISFINGDPNQLNFTEVRNNYGDENAEEFFDAILVCNELSNHKYREILTTLDLSCDIFDKEGVSAEKFQIIIDESIIQMNMETLSFIREHYSHQILYFIARNINEYVSIMTTEAFVLDEVVQILSLNIEDDTKIELLRITSEPISILDKRYSDTINVYILKNNLDFNDLALLFKTYEQWANEIQQIVYDLARDNVGLIISNSMKISDNLLKILFGSDEIDYSQKIDLLISSLSDMDKERCIEYLEILDLAEYKKVFESRTRPKYEINTTNEKLLSAFKEKGWIYDYEKDKDREGYYKIIRNKQIAKVTGEK